MSGTWHDPNWTYTNQPAPSPTGGGGNFPWDIASAGLGLLSDHISNKQRRKLEREAREWNLKQWHRQNKYNHPIEQMARLKAAGLNPNLIYGSSPGSAVGNAGSIAPGKASEYRLGNPMIPFMDTRVKQAQSNNLKADVLLKGSQAMKNVKEAGKTQTEVNLMQEQFDDMVGITASNAVLKQIEVMINNRTRYQKILQSFNQTNKETLGLNIMQWEFDNMQSSNQMKGFTMYNLASSLGFDLNTKNGREGFSIASRLAAGSKVFSLMSQGLKGILSRGKKLVGTAKKYYK